MNKDRREAAKLFQEWFDSQKYSLGALPNFFQTTEMERAYKAGYSAHASRQWVAVSERLPDVEKKRGGVSVWFTWLKDGKYIIYKGFFSDKDATGFRWWAGTEPFGTSGRGVESTRGGEVVAWMYCEKKPEPYQPADEAAKGEGG